MDLKYLARTFFAAAMRVAPPSPTLSLLADRMRRESRATATPGAPALRR